MGSAQLPTMPPGHEIDFDVEYQKLKDQLSLFEGVASKKKHLQQEQKSLQEKSAEIENLEKQQADLIEGFETMKMALVPLGKDYTAKKADWEAKKAAINPGLFNSITVFNWDIGSGSLNDLDRATRLVFEYAAWLEQCKPIVKASAEINAKGLEAKQLGDKLVEKEEALREAHLKLPTLKAELEAAELDWRQKWEEHLDKDLATINAQSMTELNSMIDKRNEELVAHKIQISELTSAIQMQKTNVNNLQAQVKGFTALQSGNHPLKISGDALQAKINDAYRRGREDEQKILMPLAIAGSYSRGRKLEWVRGDNQNENIVGLGNKASHYGMAAADAALYQDSLSEIKRTDVPTYIDLYGIHPNFVWQHRDCKQFLEMLDWRGSMKDFQVHAYANGAYELTKFHMASKALINSMETNPEKWQSAAIQEYFTATPSLYTHLKAEHDAALLRHKKYLSNR
jgi:hypothetical protein